MELPADFLSLGRGSDTINMVFSLLMVTGLSFFTVIERFTQLSGSHEINQVYVS